MHTRPGYGRWVLVATLTVCGFLVVLHEAVTRSAYEESIRGLATVSDNTAPSLLHLGAVRRGVREVALELAFETEDADLRRRLEARWPVIDTHLAAYHRLPALRGESATRAHLGMALERLRSAEQNLFATEADTPRRTNAEHEVLQIMREVQTTLDLLATENARATAELTHDVVLAHAQASALSLVLVVGIIVAFSLAGVVSYRILTRLGRQVDRRLEELDAFAGRVAHDLKGPLHPARLATQVLEREPLSPAGATALERLERSLQRANAMVDGLLAFARSGARPAPGVRSDVGEVVREVAPGLQQLATNEAALLSLEVEPRLVVAADAAVVSSILENLTRNALLHMGSAPRREVRVEARAHDRACVLSVTDTGPGIPADVLQRLFRPFERGSDRPGGSGLGLATVKRLVHAHGGAIEVRSQVGAGSTFVARLPLAEPAPPAGADRAAADGGAQDAAARAAQGRGDRR